MRHVGLKDGTTVLLREPTMEDVERSHRFFLDLPPEDRRYLRVDVTARDIVERRIRAALEGSVYRVFGLVGDKIVADGALEFSEDTWRKHTAEIRLIVARDYQHRRLGALLAADLFCTAKNRGMEKVVAKMAGAQKRARAIFEKLGFHVDSVIPDYIKDAEGEPQSLVIMSCHLDELSSELRDLYEADHWPDG